MNGINVHSGLRIYEFLEDIDDLGVPKSGGGHSGSHDPKCGHESRFAGTKIQNF